MKTKPNSPVIDWKSVEKLLKDALREDLGATGDVTSRLLIPLRLDGRARIVAKQAGTLCGVDVARRVFALAGKRVVLTSIKEDGDRLRRGDIVAEVRGPMRGILAGERTALNLLQRLSGVATLTARFAEALAPYGAHVYDTRKTTPLWRGLEKYAIWIGGGRNYRFGLYDMIMIKDNHIDAVGDLEEAIRRAVEGNYSGLDIVVEVRTLRDLRRALNHPVDVIMLDNMSLRQTRRALEIAEGASCEIEVSGGLTIARARRLAKIGVRRFSSGALTHSAPALDLSLKYE